MPWSWRTRIGEIGLQLPALFGLWAGHHIAGTGSSAVADRYAGLAEAQADTGPRLVGLRMLGLERFYEGRFEESLAITSAGLDAYDPAVHRGLTQRFGHDPRAASANYKAWNLWHLGHADQAAANDAGQSSLDPAGGPREHHRLGTLLRHHYMA